MTDIVYPAEPAVIIGEASNASEMLPVVDDHALVVGQAARKVCHGSRRLLHPVVHLHIVDRFGRLYLQHRSRNKDAYPGLWDVAVGGHVSYGESISEALVRETAEELALVDFNPIPLAVYVYESPKQRELAFVYAAVGNFNITPDNYEVQEGRWWTEQEILESFGQGVFTPVFEKEYTEFKKKIMALL